MDYQQTYQGEIFVKSSCLDHEYQLLTSIRDILALAGWHPQDPRSLIWHRGDQRVWLAIVDDIESIPQEPYEDFLATLTHRDTVITDNFISRPVRARVIELPRSWFGIYAYRPEITADEPDRDYGFAVNRIDSVRTQILLEMQQWRHLSGVQGYVNFNCASHALDQTYQQKHDLWKNICEDLRAWHGDRYDRAMQDIDSLIPFRNHDLELEQVMQRSLLNVIIETYSSDYSVSVSEKIFRALVTPRPWTVFGGMWTVARLEQLGFDCLRDIVDHKTDAMKSTEDRIKEFVRNSANHWRNLVWDEIRDRCHQAAKHNQGLLEKLGQKWTLDQPVFLDQVHDAVQ